MEYNQSVFHLRLAEMMNEIHEICIKNDIKYTMIGGTLIGALRHKGFIPWDDDIDIAMLYKDYKKFIQIVFNMKHDWMEFCLAGLSKDYYHPYIKVYDKRTTYLEAYCDIPKGIFIDVFPLSYSGDSKVSSYVQFIEHRFWQSLLKRKGYHFSTGTIRESVLILAAKLFSVSFIMHKINSQYEHLNRKPHKYISDMDGTMKGIVSAHLFSDFTFFQFEEYSFMGIKDADHYLQFVFGNYNQFPPEEEQKPHHKKYLDLNLPYQEYIRLKNEK